MYCRRLHSSLLSTSCLLLLHTNTYNNTILTPQYSQSHALTLTHSDAQVHSLKNTSTSNNVSVSVSSNPLLQHHDLPKFAKISPTDVEPAVNTVLAVAKEEFTRVEESFRDDKVPSYASTIEALEILQFPLSFSWGVTNHLMAVKNSDDLRKARETVQPSVIEFSQRVGQSRRFFKALNELKNNRKEWNALDGTQRRVVNAYLRKMKNYGVGLSESERIRFNKLQVEVSELSTKFSNNVLDSTNSFKLKVTHVSDVEGLPMSARALATEKAKAAGSPEATVESGPWVFTLDSPSYLPAMKHLKNRALRQQLYTAYVTRASSGDTDNSLVIRDILERKREMALMLGYDNYAELSISTKMAPNVDTVLKLIQMLRDNAFPAAKKEFEEMVNFAKSEGFSDKIMNWDFHYWSERLRERAYQYEEEQLRVYFPLDGVLKGLFALAERLYGVTIVSADGKVDVWDNNVRFFEIYEKSNQKYLACFYLDPFSRPEEKNSGAWMDPCIGKSRALKKTPVAYLNCNGSPPVGDTPSLMTFREVETLFHEFGHGLQHMLTRIEHGDASGINNIEWDAVELPSQFMENWCYDRETLFGFAKHYQTGEPLPEDLYQNVKAAKNFHAGIALIRQLLFATLDMTLHSSYDPNGMKSPFQVQAELAVDYAVIPPIENDRFLCSFGHLFGGGYAAGYYSYIWAEVMSADAFAAFEEAGLDNEAAVRATGKRFRDTVLAMGGGQHPSTVYKLFRGKDASPDALLRHSGLKGKKQFVRNYKTLEEIRRST